jgi:hypothetical protein
MIEQAGIRLIVARREGEREASSAA